MNVGQYKIILGSFNRQVEEFNRLRVSSINEVRFALDKYYRVATINAGLPLELKQHDQMRSMQKTMADAVINMFWELNKVGLAKFYDIDFEGVEEFEEEVEKEVIGEDGKVKIIKEKKIRVDSYEILERVASRKRYLVKGGNNDINRTAVLVIRDWQQGKLRL